MNRGVVPCRCTLQTAGKSYVCVLLKHGAGVTKKDENSQLERQRAQKNWDTLLQLMTVELPELVCIQNYRAHNYDHPYSIDLGLPKDENIPDGENGSATTRGYSVRLPFPRLF